jgi:hypothetical protein
VDIHNSGYCIQLMEFNSLQYDHASVCAIFPQHTGIHAATDSYDSQSHRCVKRQQSSVTANTTRVKERRHLGELTLCVGAGCTDNAVATQVSRPSERRH